MDITVRGTGGEDVRVSEVRKGDVFGEASIFMDLPRTANAIARSACLVAAVSRDRLFAYCERNPGPGSRSSASSSTASCGASAPPAASSRHERESVVTAADLEELGACFPKSLEEIMAELAGPDRLRRAFRVAFRLAPFSKQCI